MTRRPPPWLSFALLGVLGLFCLRAVLAQPAPPVLTVAGNIAVLVLPPPEPVDCTARGWSVFVPTTGTVYRAARMVGTLQPLALEIVFAIEECVFVDGFEVAP